jgi:cell division protein FtsQ
MKQPATSTGLVRRIAIVFLGLLVAIALTIGGWWGYRELASQPVKRVVFSGDLDRLPHAELDSLTRAIQANASPSIESIREAARRVTWVRDATVRREFPAAVVISFEAHQAAAYWDDGRMVSTTGEVFTARDAAKLPRFRGPEGAAATMLREYAGMAKAVEPLGTTIAELRLSRRGAWTAVLESGLTLQLGRGPALPRLERFAAAWPQVSAARPDYVDLRYPNGFAIRRAATLTVTPSHGLPQGGGKQ